MSNQKIFLWSLFVVILAIVAFSVYKSYTSGGRQAQITNFEECPQAGYPVMESYPRGCRTATGDLFVENVPNTNSTPEPTPEPVDGTTTGFVAGHVTIGPNCAGPEIEGRPCPASEEAYTSRSVIVYGSDATTIKTKGSIDFEGNYKIVLTPGDYFIQISPAGIGPGEKKPATVKAGATTTVDFDIDTGIR